MTKADSSEEIIDAEVLEETTEESPDDQNQTSLETAAAEVTEREKLAVESYIESNEPMSLSQAVEHVNLMHRMLNEIMKEDVHYGKIPGTTDKVVLLQPGGDLINLIFKLVPKFTVARITRDNGHMDFDCKCQLSTRDGVLIAEGEAYASTMESKYRYRNEGKICPECSKSTIIKGKAEYGGGWLCFGKKGGCGTKWADGTEQAREFEAATSGKIENDNIADTYNTVKKMGCKRAKMSADNNAVAGTDIFTVDLEDMEENAAAAKAARKAAQPTAPAKPAAKPTPAVDPAEALLTEAQKEQVLTALAGSCITLTDLDTSIYEKTNGLVKGLTELRVKHLNSVLNHISDNPSM